jgi:glycosyltransferase involved in cell wall biosynthesis
MKTLFLCTALPFPLDVGSRQRTFHLLKGLARVSDVRLVAMGEPHELERAAPVRELCESVELIPRRSMEWMRSAEQPRVVKWLKEALFLLHPRRPSALAWSRILDAPRRAAAAVRQGYDFVLAYRLGWMDALPSDTRSRVLVDLDDVEHRKLGLKLRFVGLTRQWPIEAADYLKFRRLERGLWRSGFEFAVCSETEASALPSRTRVRIIPNGVNLPPLDPNDGRPPATVGRILFVGTMNYSPNEDAAVFFAREVWPRIRSRQEAELRIVGHSPPPSVQRLSGLPGVRVLGSVPDIEPELRQASVVVAPLRYGGGTRIKVLEAMAYGKPLVATSFAVDGLGLEPGRHVLTGDDAVSLAAACQKVLDDPDEGVRVGRQGRILVEERYQWERIEKIVAEAALGRPAATQDLLS